MAVWTDEMKEFVRECWESGNYTCSNIADAFNRKYHDDKTRSAIAGMIHRNKWTQPGSPSRNDPRKRNPRKRIPRKKVTSRPAAVVPTVAKIAKPAKNTNAVKKPREKVVQIPENDTCSDTGDRWVPYADRNPSGCAYPGGDTGAWTACNAIRANKKVGRDRPTPYCDDHHKRCYRLE